MLFNTIKRRAVAERDAEVLRTIDEYSKWLSHEFPDAGRALDNLACELSGLSLNAGTPVFADEPCTISTLREQMRRNRDRRAEPPGEPSRKDQP